MSGQVSVYRRRGRTFVCVYARSGFAWREASAHELPGPLTPAGLGAAVRSALHASTVARAPGRWRRAPPDGRLPELAGVTSWLGFARGAVGVAVAELDGTVSVVPMRRDGGAFLDLDEGGTARALDDTDDQALGTAVEQGLALAR